MDKIKRNTLVVGVSILPKHQEYIDHLMAEKAFMSASDVHRRAIEFLHEKTFPDYIFNKSATDLKKREELTEKQKMEAMTDREYVDAFVKGLVLPTKDGKQAVIIHWFGNALGAVPVDGAKEWFSQGPEYLENHLDILGSKSIEERLSAYSRSVLASKYGIIFPDDLSGKTKKTEPHK